MNTVITQQHEETRVMLLIYKIAVAGGDLDLLIKLYHQLAFD